MLSILIASAAHPDSVEICGTLVRGVECALLEATDGERYVLDDPGEFVVGDSVRVIGERDRDCVSICQEGDGCIAVAYVSYCDGDTIKACGKLVAGIECVLFEDDRGFLFPLENRGSFEPGDRVRVVGRFSRECATICQQSTGCIEDNQIEAAPADGTCTGDDNNDDEDGSPACPAVSIGLLLATAAFLFIGARRGTA
jgi:hypothetical protein